MQFSVYNHPPHLFALNLIISSFIANSTWLHDVFKVVGAVALQGKKRLFRNGIEREASRLRRERDTVNVNLRPVNCP